MSKKTSWGAFRDGIGKRLLSLALVLTMLISMVPGALAETPEQAEEPEQEQLLVTEPEQVTEAGEPDALSEPEEVEAVSEPEELILLPAAAAETEQIPETETGEESGEESAPETSDEPESDPSADLETAEDWEQSLAGAELRGHYAADLLAVARTQLGYRESSLNFERREPAMATAATVPGLVSPMRRGTLCLSPSA